MAFNYLLDPCIQHQNRAGVNNVHGFFKVFLLETDDIAETYSDFSGTLNPERIEIDNNGRCVIIADDSRPYRVEMYLPNGDLVYTQAPIWTIASGGGGAALTDIESSDGSISVDKTTVGGKTTFDIGVNHEDDPAFLDWIKCSGSSASSGNLVPNKADGTMSVGSLGVELSADMLYHVTGIVRGTKDGVGPDYDSIEVHLSLNDGETSTEVQTFTFIVDRSLGLPQDFNFDADIKAGSVESELVVSVTGAEAGMSFSLPLLDIHRIYSGIPKIPGGIATQGWVDNNYQKKLTAGTGISIDPATDTISATPQVQSDWNEANTSSPAYIRNKPDMDSYATKQEVTTGLAGKQDTISDLATIRSGAAAGATAVQPGDLATVATSGSYNDLSDKPSIPAPVTVDQHYNASSTNAQSGTAVAEALDSFEALPASTVADAGKVLRVDTNGDPEWAADESQQVQSDWAQTDSSAVDYIKNKPNLAPVATSGSYSDLSNKPSLAAVATSGSYNDLSDKPSIPPAQIQSDWNQSNNQAVDYIKNKPNLATVATSGSYNDLSDKPSIPAAQQQADWNEADSAAIDYIKNKPDLSGFATKTEVTQGLAGKQDTISDLATIRSGAAEGATAVQPGDLAAVATSGSYNDLSDKPSIPDPQVQADWSQSDNTKVDYIKNKPNLASVATSGSYNDLADKPSIPAAQVNADWNASSGVAEILNKPTLATVATTGDYDDLSNKPTIPAAQVNSDWNASSGVAEILNKPTILPYKPVVAGTGVRIVDDTANNRIVVEADETVLWESSTWSDGGDVAPGTNSSTLSEAIDNFERICVHYRRSRLSSRSPLISQQMGEYDVSVIRSQSDKCLLAAIFLSGAGTNLYLVETTLTFNSNNLGFSETQGGQASFGSSFVVGTCYLHPYKIVGINRIASN